MADSRPEMRPLRRRATVVVSQWVQKLAKQDRPAVYRALIGLLSEEDNAIVLASIATLQARCIEINSRLSSLLLSCIYLT